MKTDVSFGFYVLTKKLTKVKQNLDQIQIFLSPSTYHEKC